MRVNNIGIRQAGNRPFKHGNNQDGILGIKVM